MSSRDIHTSQDVSRLPVHNTPITSTSSSIYTQSRIHDIHSTTYGKTSKILLKSLQHLKQTPISNSSSISSIYTNNIPINPLSSHNTDSNTSNVDQQEYLLQEIDSLKQYIFVCHQFMKQQGEFLHQQQVLLQQLQHQQPSIITTVDDNNNTKFKSVTSSDDNNNTKNIIDTTDTATTLTVDDTNITTTINDTNDIINTNIKDSITHINSNTNVVINTNNSNDNNNDTTTNDDNNTINTNYSTNDTNSEHYIRDTYSPNLQTLRNSYHPKHVLELSSFASLEHDGDCTTTTTPDDRQTISPTTTTYPNINQSINTLQNILQAATDATQSTTQ